MGIIGGGAGQSGDPGYRHTHRDNNDHIEPKIELTKIFCSLFPFFLKVNIRYEENYRDRVGEMFRGLMTGPDLRLSG